MRATQITKEPPGKPRHDLLYASASLSRLAFARANLPWATPAFLPYDRLIDYLL